MAWLFAPLLAIGTALLGCPAPLPGPEIDDISPDFAFNGDLSTVTIIGRRFYPEVEVDAWSGGADVDKSFTAWLIGPDGVQNRYAFSGVSIVDDQHLAATLEPGLPKGRYTVEIESPAGERGLLERAFTVTDTEAAKLVIETDEYFYTVGDVATVRLKLLDIGDNIVPIDLEVAFTALPTVGAVSFPSHTLSSAGPTPDGDGIHGLLQDGEATVQLSVSLPSTVTLEVAPWNNPESEVNEGTLALSFQPGSDQRVELRLPLPPDPKPEFVAGEPFYVEAELVDQFGNPVPGPAQIDLQTTCSGFVLNNFEIDGPTLVAVTPERASDNSCPEDKLVSSSPPGESSPFTIIAGEVDHFYAVAGDLDTDPFNIRAGDLVTVNVEPQDAYGNRASWTGTMHLSDPDSSLVETTCAPWLAWWYCTGRATLARPEMAALVVGDDGTFGVSNLFDVIADDVPASLDVEVLGPAAAGVPHPAIVRPYDAYGNPMFASDLGPEAFVLSDDSGSLSCTFADYEPDGEARFDCLFTTAMPGWTLRVDIPAFALSAISDPFEVVNGSLSTIRFEGEAPVTAGQGLSLTLIGEDTYGNPYVVQDDPTIALWDDSGSLSPALATLGIDGSVTVSASFTRSGVSSVHAEQAGVPLGSSDPITVSAGPADSLAITPLLPWAFVSEPVGIRVETIDIYGNRADWSGSALLSSQTTSASDLSVPLVNGIGTGTFLWPEPSQSEILGGTAGAFSGMAPVIVASRCPTGSPTASVSFGGYGEAITCADPQGEAILTADFSASSGTDLSGYAITDGLAPPVTSEAPTVDLSLSGIGRHDLLALVIDEAGCGDEIAATAWIGPDDGSPTGPVLLTSQDSSIAVFDSIDIDVSGVSDCTRDPASGASLAVRATGGALDAPPTGSGLELLLDASGEGSLSLQTAGGLAWGGSTDPRSVEIYASTPSGSASGVLAVPLSGDNLRPIVLSQTPSGQSAGIVSEISLLFSEPLLPSTVIPSNFSVTGPTAVTVSGATLSGSTVTLSLSPPADGSLGGYTINATTALRDLAGNKLSGDYSGAQADYHGGFGDAGLATATLLCTFSPETLLFRPDGDPGSDIESDEIVFGLSGSEAPAWWVIEVRDEGGALAFFDREVPLAATDTVSWDGRDLQGLIVQDGIWQVSVSPDDGLGNRGVGCEALVVVDNARVTSL